MNKKSPIPLSLAERRKYARISLQTVSERTKIGIPYLEAIEAANYKALPGGIIALNFLRQYAEAVGIDPAPLIRNYKDHDCQGRATQRGPAAAESGFFARLFRLPA